MFSGLGALVAVFGLLQLPLAFPDLPASQATLNAFYITASILVVVGIIVFFTLYKDNPSFSFRQRKFIIKRNHIVHPAMKNRTNILRLIIDGLISAKDYRVALAYVNGFAARTSTIIVTLFIPLWVNAYFNDNNLCPEVDPRNENQVRELCRDAFSLASIITGTAQVAALVGAPFFGVLADRFGHTSSLQVRRKYAYFGLPSFVATALVSISYFLLFRWTDPREGGVIAVAILLGIGEIGTIVTGTALASAEYVRPEVRGSVAGMFSLFGALGKSRTWPLPQLPCDQSSNAPDEYIRDSVDHQTRWLSL